MSQSFKLSFDKPLESASNKTVSSPSENGELNSEFYEQESYGRNICFVKENYSRIFLSYGHLISGEYNPEENCIELVFTSHSVSIKGFSLETIYYQLMTQSIKQLVCTDARYNLLENEKKSLINKIEWIVKE